MNALRLIVLLGLGVGLYLLFTRKGEAASFNPYIGVTTAGASISDADYAEALRNAGYDPAQYGLGDPAPLYEGEWDNLDQELAQGFTMPFGNAFAEPPLAVEPAPDYIDIEPYRTAVTMDPAENLSAFLALIRQVETGTAGPAAYSKLVGGGTFNDFSDHPANKGWPGVTINGVRTAAAGAYQIQPGTWAEVLKRQPLPDFSPTSQDAAAIVILQFPWRDAYRDVLEGNFDSAIRKLALEWEAFERILAGSYHVTLAQARSIYQASGGSIA